tara:strand:- start:2805 stop:3770 length:966 start_codon:yes stop_codon:yes gene_type:complete
MGVRRKSRARVAAINKAGLKKDVSPSPLVMSDNIVEASQFRIGQMVITDLVLDLASTKNTLFSQALAAADPIGTNTTNVSYLCQLTKAVFGVVTQVETINLEQCTDGTLKDYDLMFGDGDGYLGSDASNDTALASDIFASAGTALGKHTTTQIDTSVSANGLLDKYLYITAGDVTTAKASCTIDCSSATVGNVTSAVTTIFLDTHAGTRVPFVADSGTAFGGSPAANKFNIGSVTTTAELAEGIKLGVDNNSNFTAVRTDSTVLVTVSTVALNSNNNNFLTDDPEKASGIVVPNMTGGIPNQITAGKLLVRITGHIEPDDL